MRRWNPVLSVLLLASLLANGLLAVRLARSGGEAPASAERPAIGHSAASPSDPAPLRETLAAERKKNEELQARIKLLETDKKVLALETPGTARPDKIAAFREKMRKLKKYLTDPAHKNKNDVDPENVVDLTDAMMDIMKMTAARTKEPKAYADCLQAVYEIGLEGEGTSLTTAQTATLNALLQGFAEQISQIPASPAGDRLLREVQVEGAAMGKLQALLTDDQHKALKEINLEGVSSFNFLSTAYVTKEGAATQIAQQWSAAYQLDESQLPQAKAAAQAYVDALARIEAEAPGGDPTFSKPGSPEAYVYRERMVKEQLAALNALQASLTPAQVDRLRTQTMKEIHVIDASGNAKVTTPDK